MRERNGRPVRSGECPPNRPNAPLSQTCEIRSLETNVDAKYRTAASYDPSLCGHPDCPYLVPAPTCAHCGDEIRPGALAHAVTSRELGLQVWFHGEGPCHVVAMGGSPSDEGVA